MDRRRLTGLTGLTGLAVAAVLAAGCTGGDGGADPTDPVADNEGRKAASQPCDGLLRRADREAALPSNIPGYEGATFYEVQAQGATRRHFAHIAGTDLVGTRDKISADFRLSGFEIRGSDEEEGAEAEFQWRGRDREGSVQVVPLCQGHLRLRWRIEPR